MEFKRTFGLDIGGTLAKLAYLDDREPRGPLDFETSQGTVHLKIFESNKIDEIVQFLHRKHFSCDQLAVTGGGAFKYSSVLEEKLNCHVLKLDEMASLHAGFNLVIQEEANPSYTYSIKNGFQNYHAQDPPSLLCNIGSGVSIIKLLRDSFERVTGSCLGGGTALGLATSIVGVNSYQELLDMCESGNANNADLLYSDIYGGHTDETLAVSLGKIAMSDPNEYHKNDIAKSLLNMVAYNIGQIAYLTARIQNIDHVYFGGNFIRGYHYTMDRITFSVEYWSNGEIKPLFLKHDGYFGALGALTLS